jgi:hypothetical protein
MTVSEVSLTECGPARWQKTATPGDRQQRKMNALLCSQLVATNKRYISPRLLMNRTMQFTCNVLSAAMSRPVHKSVPCQIEDLAFEGQQMN